MAARFGGIRAQTGGYVNPVDSLQKGLTGLQNTMIASEKMRDDEEARKELLAQRALENQRANDRLGLEKAQNQRAEVTANRNKAIYDAGLAKEKAIANVDKNSGNYMYRGGEGVTPELDKRVLAYFGAEDYKPPEEGTAGYADSLDKINRVARQYEAIPASREDAIARYSKALVDAGEDPANANAKAAIVMGGLVSNKETIAAANATAKSKTEHNKWLSGERNKAAIADTKAMATIAKSYATDGSSEKKAMESITKMISGLDTGTFGWGDNKTDAMDLVNYYKDHIKIPASVINQAMIAATDKGGIFFDKHIDQKMMNDYLTRIAVDYSTKNGNSGAYLSGSYQSGQSATKVKGYEVVTNPTVAFKEGKAEYDQYRKNLNFLKWDDLPNAETEAKNKRQAIIDAASKQKAEEQKIAEKKKTEELKKIAEKKKKTEELKKTDGVTEEKSKKKKAEVFDERVGSFNNMVAEIRKRNLKKSDPYKESKETLRKNAKEIQALRDRRDAAIMKDIAEMEAINPNLLDSKNKEFFEDKYGDAGIAMLKKRMKTRVLDKPATENSRDKFLKQIEENNRHNLVKQIKEGNEYYSEEDPAVLLRRDGDNKRYFNYELKNIVDKATK